ncbi:MAG: hypothetical protein K5751_08585 [Treponemataceae bacterium]|nr:hypothetical protein [Treponemataceae bacterium]
MMKPENGQNGGTFGVVRKAMLRALVEAEVERQKKGGITKRRFGLRF